MSFLYFLNIVIIIVIGINVVVDIIKDYLRWSHCKVKIEGKVVKINRKLVGKRRKLYSQPICEYNYNDYKFVNPVGVFSKETYTENEIIHFKINKDDPNETYMPTPSHKQEIIISFILLAIAIIFLITR